MYGWVKLIIHITVLTTHFIVCMSGPTKTYDFIKYNETDSEFNMLSCARLARPESACGCKMDVHSRVYYSLWHNTWCNNQTLQSGYKYAETQSVRIHQPLLSDVTPWNFGDDIPVCMSSGSVIGIRFSFKPSNESTWRLIISLYNKDSYKAMRVIIRNGGGKTTFTFETLVDDDQIDSEVQSFDGLYMVVNETYFLEFEVLEHSFKMYVNGSLYHEYGVLVTDTIPVSVFIRIGATDFQYIEYRK